MSREIDDWFAGLAFQESEILDCVWKGGLAILRQDEHQARRFLQRAMEVDRLQVASPIKVYDRLMERGQEHAAAGFIRILMEERNALIYQDIETAVRSLRSTPYVDYPLDVQIESLARCNAACSFCVYPNLKRVGDRMPEEMFLKILDDLERIPKDLPFNMTLYGVNEPFLDKRIWDWMRIITDRLPQATISLNTNGSPLTREMILRLAEYRVARMSVSLNEFDPDRYEALMKIPFDRSVEVLRILNDLKGSGVLSFPVGVTRAGDGTIRDLRFIAWVRENFPNLSCNYSPQFEWIAPEKRADLGGAPDIGCTHWFDLTIRANGEVSFCCIDGHNAWPRGQVADTHVLDIYNDPMIRHFRQNAVGRPQVPQCADCHSG